MVTGQRAFPGDSAIATMTAILRDEVRPMRQFNPAAPEQLSEIVGKCLRKNRDERWQTMDELLAALENLKLQYDTGTAPTAQVSIAPKKSKRTVAILAAVGGTVALAGGIWWAAARHRAAQTPPAPPPAAAEAPRQAVAAPPGPDAATPAPPAAPAGAPGPLSNDSIVQMLEAKVPTAVIVGHIRSSKTQFDLSTAALIRLSQAGAPEALIQAMRDASRPAAPASAATAPAPVKPDATAPAAAPANPAPAPPAAPPAPAAAAPSAGAEKLIAISDAAPITIELAEDIPLNARAGTPLKFTVLKDVLAGDTVAISKGAVVTGQVAGETRKKALVLRTEMTFQLEQVDAAGGQKLKVRATPTASTTPSRRAVDSGTSAGARKKPKDVAAIAGTQFVAYNNKCNESITVRR